MKTGGWPSRKTVGQLAAIAPQAVTTSHGNIRQAWRNSRRRSNHVDEFVIPESPVFELVPLEFLPAFDASKTLKTLLLSHNQIRRLNAFRSQWKYAIAFMLQLGNLLMLLTTAAPRHIGVIMALVAPVLQFPGMIFIVASMRIEMLYLLFGTYDFWYFTVNNVIFGVCFTAMLRDVRVIIVLVGCVIVQISIAADALVGDRRQLYVSSIINCGTHLAMFVAVFLRRVDDNGNGDAHLLSYSSSGYGFSIRDTLMNTQLNMILLFGRLVYRNWVAMREQDSAIVRRVNSQTSYIPDRRRCVSYYCTVGLRLKRSIVPTVVRPRSISSTPRTSTNDGRSTRSRAGSVISVQALDNSYHARMRAHAAPELVKVLPATRLDHRHSRIQHLTRIQLQFVHIEDDFQAFKTLVPGFGRLLDRVLSPSASVWRRRVLLETFHALGYIGMGVLVLGALTAWISKDQNLDNIRQGLAQTQKLAFLASFTFCGVFFAAYQRQLLRRLYSSFNFLFLSTKLTVASLALCQFFAWDRRVIWVWGAWIWMQWALTLDALPPNTMRLLNFRRSTLMLLVLAFELTGLIILSLELFAFDRWIIPNRAVIDKVIMGHQIRVSTLSALVSRLWTIFLWDFKLIWLLSASLRRRRHRRLSAVDMTEPGDDDEGERLILTGQVEYLYEWVSHRRPRNASSRWLRGFQLLRISRAMTRRQTNVILRLQDQ